ncbi:rCG63532 [Rattus norvegicus]|uniref:RCG63532 n=1 Tax=Rattus norvegicus TaxID=10116 RepID=A6J9W5_RAT|nr:rCG63532 [Rattus norvegicus]
MNVDQHVIRNGRYRTECK